MKRISHRSLVAVTTFSVGMFLSALFPHRSDVDEIASFDITDVDQSVTTVTTVSGYSPATRIRKVDFTNFTYPSEFVGYRGGFKVTNGERPPNKRTDTGIPLDIWLKLGDVSYGDVTGDGVEEAIVDLGWITGGSAIPDLIYVFGLNGNDLKLLWAFETGDRADGGYRDVFVEDGQLVVELLGKNKIIGKNLYAGDGTNNGLCCPTVFTRSRYQWTGNRFTLKQTPQVLPL